MLRTQSSNACVTAMLPSLATHETLWRTQNLCPGHMKMFLKRVGNIFCVRAPSNNVAVFSQAQDTKVDTFSHNVSATMCPSLAKHFHVSMQDTNFVSATMFRAWLNLATSRHTR